MSDVTVLRAERWVDVETGEVRSPAVVVVDGNQIVAVNPKELPSPADRDRPRRRHAAARASWTWSSTCSSADPAGPTGCPIRCTG